MSRGLVEPVIRTDAPGTTWHPAATSCTHRLAGGPLQCTNPRPHNPGAGCTYESSSAVDDHHPEGGHG